MTIVTKCLECLWENTERMPHSMFCKGEFETINTDLDPETHPGVAEVRTTSSTGGQKGVKVERFDLIPIGPLTELAKHYGRGARKYEDHQWRKGYEWSKSYAAIQRHLTAFWGGEDYDTCPKTDDGTCSNIDVDGNEWAFGGLTSRGPICYNHTGSHHMVAVAWHAFTLLEYINTHPEHDDRYTP